MQSKRTTEESDERGVSPVIGVILMVAITVILAAVIAAFVLDIGPGETDPSASYDVDITGDEGDETIELTLNSLDGSADGIGVVADVTEDNAEIEDDPLTVSGQSEDYENGGWGDDTAVIAYSADSEPDDLGEVDNYAIIDNLEDLEDE